MQHRTRVGSVAYVTNDNDIFLNVCRDGVKRKYKVWSYKYCTCVENELFWSEPYFEAIVAAR